MIRLLAFALLLLPTLSRAEVIRVGQNPEDLRFSANGSSLAMRCDDHVYVRDLKRARTYRFPKGELRDISPGGTRIAMSDAENGQLTIWDVARSKAIRVWPHPTACATFSPDGRQVIFFAGQDRQSLENAENLTLIRLDIRSGNTKRYDRWCASLSNFMANWFTKNGSTHPIKMADVRYYALYGPFLRWRNGGVVQATVQVDDHKALVFVVFTMELRDQKPDRILPGFGLYYLWNGDYLWKESSHKVGTDAPIETFAVWHQGRSHKLIDDPDFVSSPAPSGDSGSYAGVCPSDTPWIAFYGIRNIAQLVDEPYTSKQLQRQRLIVKIVNSRTRRKVVVVNRHYYHVTVAAALAPKADWVAFTSPRSSSQIVLQKIRQRL